MRRVQGWIAGMVVVGLSLSLCACALRAETRATTTATPIPAWTEPDSSGVLRLFSRNGIAHGCPIDETHLLTARHVAIDDNRKELKNVVWSDRDGHTGSAWVEDYDLRRDVALMKSDTPFKRVYPIAEYPPVKDERVAIVGYDFGNGLSPRVDTVRVIRQISAHLVLTAGGAPGFSGSCVLNARGQVVGVFHWQIGDGIRSYGIASVVTNGWRSVGWLPQRPSGQ